jgi:HD-GYP domain-containing protein (c-di-GMP phosphodiesterase class II)
MDSSLGDVGMRAKLFETASKIKFFEHHLHLEEDPIHALRLTVGSNFFDLGASFDHAVNVAALSGRLCEAFECIPKEVVDVSIAAMFHDIGKIGIPAEILEKPGSLTEVERQIVMSHVILGKEILSQGNTAAMKLAAQVAYCHHERWDGSGYPNRVVGDKIPFAARVVAIADVYEAITSERTYHCALEHHEAIKKLTTEMSPCFDPVLLKTFCAIFPDRETILTVVKSFRRDFITRTETSNLKDGLQ